MFDVVVYVLAWIGSVFAILAIVRFCAEVIPGVLDARSQLRSVLDAASHLDRLCSDLYSVLEIAVADKARHPPSWVAEAERILAAFPRAKADGLVEKLSAGPAWSMQQGSRASLPSPLRSGFTEPRHNSDVPEVP